MEEGMSIENIKKIAEGLGLSLVEHPNRFTGVPILYLSQAHYFRDTPFNPYESEADAFKVLEALVKSQPNIELGQPLRRTEEGDREYHLQDYNGEVVFNKDLKHAICSAYLSLIDNKGKI